MIFENRLREELVSEYVKLQRRVDGRVASTLGCCRKGWKIQPPDGQSIAELQAAIQRMKIVLATDPTTLARIWNWISKQTNATEEYDGTGLS